MLKLALGGAEHLSGRILWRLERAAMSHCCDVLGFSERVFRDALSGLHTYIQTVIDAIRPFQGIRVILFSDTVVIYTLEDTEDSFQEIVTITSRLLYSLLMAGVPVRGAISHGSFVRSEHDEHGTVIAGRPIVDAHHYESRLQWIGIMLTPSALEQVPGLTAERCRFHPGLPDATMQSRFYNALKALEIQPCALALEMPSSDVTQFEGFAIVPIAPVVTDLAGLRDSLDQTRVKLERVKQLAPDSRSQEKYRRSIDWLLRVRGGFLQTFSRNIQAPHKAIAVKSSRRRRRA